MGEGLRRALALDSSFHLPTYARKPVLFTRGEGMRLHDDEGRSYLDFVAAIGSVNLGHAHPAVAEAVCAQMSRLVAVSNLYHTEHRAELAQRLSQLFTASDATACDVAPAISTAKVFFANSGAEANEGAIKLARKWGHARRGPECHEIVTLLGSFHGRTLATLAATGQPAKRAAFEPVPGGFVHVAPNDIAALDAAITPQTCAIMLEPILGEGGVWPLSADYLEAAARLANERDVLLVFDEVQTGMWRTGPVFAHQAFGVRPHVMTLAKSLANGLPIGALVAAEEIADVFAPGDHGSTFGGGPVVCAAALATLDAHEAVGSGANALVVGAYLRERLAALAGSGAAVEDVRGAGLMVGVSLSVPIATEMAAALLGRGFVVNHIGTDILRFLPPLVCESSDIDTLLDAVSDAFEEVSA